MKGFLHFVIWWAALVSWTSASVVPWLCLFGSKICRHFVVVYEEVLLFNKIRYDYD